MIYEFADEADRVVVQEVLRRQARATVVRRGCDCACTVNVVVSTTGHVERRNTTHQRGCAVSAGSARWN